MYSLGILFQHICAHFCLKASNILYNVYHNMFECADRDKTITKYDTVFDTGVNFHICGCLYVLAMFSQTCSSHRRLCFRLGAKCKNTTRTKETYNVFMNICFLCCILASILRFSSSDYLFVLSCKLIHFTRGMLLVCTADPIDRIHLIHFLDCRLLLVISFYQAAISCYQLAIP